MPVTNNRNEKVDIYDDYMEPLSSVKRQYKRFEIEHQKFAEDRRENLVPYAMGGVPVLGEEETKSVYVDNQDSHTLVLGATGSKKTRIVVMPTVRLLGWAGESMVISDPKAEIYNRTALELEKLGYRIIVLNFRKPVYGNGWNPLSIPYQFYQAGDIDRACEMVNDIAKNLLAADDKDKDPFWQNSAADLFFGLVLTLFKLCTEDEKTEMAVNISNVLKLRRQLLDESSPSGSPIWDYVKDDEIIAPALSGIVLTAKDTRAGIVSTFDQKVRYFVYQPNLMNMLSNNTIMLDQISEEKTAVFMIMPDEKTTFHTLISLFVKQSYEYLIYRAQETKNGQMKIRLNYILDEFSSLPTIKDFPSMITAARSRNIRFCLIVQSKHQLSQRYGEETETIQSNCTNWIFLTSREVPLLKEISTLCGNIREGKMSLVSVFALQHLDKENGQALMLCGRNRPYYAYLPDIDVYDGGKFGIRSFSEDPGYKQRIDVDGVEIAVRLKGEKINSFHEWLSGLEDAAALEGISSRQTQKESESDDDLEQSIDDLFKSLTMDEEDGFFEKSKPYADEIAAGFSAYENGDFENAKNHFIEAKRLKPHDEAGDCDNNLGYMLRRKEIKELIIDGILYDVPDILQAGVNEKKPFFLINMALYSSMMDPYVDMSRGGYYIRQIECYHVSRIQEWWEMLARKGELEGYMVLYWLYKYELADSSEIGSMQEIRLVLETEFGVIPELVSEIRCEKME